MAARRKKLVGGEGRMGTPGGTVIHVNASGQCAFARQTFERPLAVEVINLEEQAAPRVVASPGADFASGRAAAAGGDALVAERRWSRHRGDFVPAAGLRPGARRAHSAAAAHPRRADGLVLPPVYRRTLLLHARRLLRTRHRHVAHQPARQRRLRRGVPQRQPPRLGRRRLPRFDAGRGQNHRDGDCGRGSAGRLRLELRRLYDKLDHHADAALRGRVDWRPGDESDELYRHGGYSRLHRGLLWRGSLGRFGLLPGDHSPIFHVTNVETPAIIQHGEADVRVPIEQGLAILQRAPSTGHRSRDAPLPAPGPRD